MAEFKEVYKGKEVFKGKEVYKGSGPEPGSANSVAEDIFRQASELGGVMVVAIVTPLAACGPKAASERSPRGLALAALKSKAESRDDEAAQLRREIEERQLKLLELAAKVAGSPAVSAMANANKV